MTDSTSYVALRYAVRPVLDAWVLRGGPVPESIVHDEAAEAFKLLLKSWAQELSRPVRIARNLAIRWLEQAPRVGIDPDVCVLDPAPPDAATLDSLCLWRPGHLPPTICVEIVRARHPHKDYRDVHERYAALGTRELVVFDRLLAVSNDRAGKDGWLTREERERTEKERERTEKERERTEKERERTEKERERAVREEVERKLATLEQRLQDVEARRG